MKIAIIDADLIGRAKHRFPNLACEKISDYHKELGNEATARYLAEFEKRYPQIAEKYFDIKWNK